MSNQPLPGEDVLIAGLAALLPAPRQTLLAIGDDAAVVSMPGGEVLLITTDMLMEDVHFRLSWGDLPSLGWKALAQNLSDIAAMGGTPTHAVIALAIPPAWSSREPAELYRGLSALAAEAHVDIVGGDTIRSSGPLTISVTVLGRAPANLVLTRSGARAGDALFVTGSLGRAAAGLRLLECGRSIPPSLNVAVEAQLRPQPRLSAALALASSRLVTSMMDLSDGVATDLHRLCRASDVGAVIDARRLPIDSVVVDACKWLGENGDPCDPLDVALCGGEDFELLFTALASAEGALREAIAPIPLSCIGRMTAEPEVSLCREGIDTPLSWGFTHF